jgi:hypothetical protein
MWGQPPSPALSEAEGAVHRAKLDAVFVAPGKTDPLPADASIPTADVESELK